MKYVNFSFQFTSRPIFNGFEALGRGYIESKWYAKITVELKT